MSSVGRTSHHHHHSHTSVPTFLSRRNVLRFTHLNHLDVIRRTPHLSRRRMFIHSHQYSYNLLTIYLGMVWPIPQKTLQPNSRSSRRNDQGFFPSLSFKDHVVILFVCCRLRPNPSLPCAPFKPSTLIHKKNASSTKESKTSLHWRRKRPSPVGFSLGQQDGVGM